MLAGHSFIFKAPLPALTPTLHDQTFPHAAFFIGCYQRLCPAVTAAHGPRARPKHPAGHSRRGGDTARFAASHGHGPRWHFPAQQPAQRPVPAGNPQPGLPHGHPRSEHDRGRHLGNWAEHGRRRAGPGGGNGRVGLHGSAALAPAYHGGAGGLPAHPRCHQRRGRPGPHAGREPAYGGAGH